MKPTNTSFLMLSIISFMIYGCAIDQNKDKFPDYSNASCWISIPDSIDKPVDVFYIYPTIFGGTGEMNMNITNDQLRKKAQVVAYEQGGVYMAASNFFAPYYRQVAMDVLTMPEDTLDKYFAIGYNDVIKAFVYYLDNFNDGRPFILAGHSQGSMVLIELMKEMFDNPELQNRLVAAYLIGYSVTSEDLAKYSWMKLAESEDDVGVIITYNTQSEDATDSPVLLPGAQCINPLNWTTTTETAPKELNLGAVFFKDNGEIDSVVPQFTNAWIDENGALVAGTPDVDVYSVGTFPRGIYHKYDYNFFYNNLKKNVRVRVKNFPGLEWEF